MDNNKNQLRHRVAKILSEFLDAEAAPRCKIIPFPVRPAKPHPARELHERLAKTRTSDE